MEEFKGKTLHFFFNLDAAFEKNKVDLDAELKVQVEAHLHSLKQEFERYFSDLANTDLPEWKLPKNLFRVEVGILPDKIQEQFLKLKYNFVDFERMPLNDFWAKCVREYRNISLR